MSSTDDLDRISAIVAAAGAKLLYTGDHEQLAAVGAGGMLELLVRDAGRGRADRDPPVHPRLGARRVGPAARGRPGRASRSTTRTAGSGAAPSRRCSRPRSAATSPTSCRGAGRCWSCGPRRWPRSCRRRSAPSWSAPGGSRPRCSPRPATATSSRVGDLIQARRNDYTLRVHGARPVTNREMYEVIGRNRLTGTLTVRDRDGILAHLPAAYVQQHTTLAYAVTAYGAQGLTVDTSHSLVDQRHHPRRGVRAGQPRPRRQHLLRRSAGTPPTTTTPSGSTAHRWRC